MSAIIVRKGKTTTVKNLGWLVRNAHEVTAIEVTVPSDETGFLESSVVLTAHLFGEVSTVSDGLTVKCALAG